MFSWSPHPKPSILFLRKGPNTKKGGHSMTNKKKALLIALPVLAILLTSAGLAIWHFHNANDETGKDIGLDHYIDDGSVSISNFRVGGIETDSFSLSNSETLSSLDKLITFDVLHNETNEIASRPDTYSYNVEAIVSSSEIAEYIKVIVDFSAWTSSEVTATISATVAWKDGKEPSTPSEWNVLNDIITSATGDGSNKILFRASALGE